MGRTLILYGTNDGHTRKVAERVCDWCSTHGPVVVVDSAEAPSNFKVADFDNVIVAGSVHEGHHQHALTELVTRHAVELAEKPTLFLSVSLSAVNQDEQHRAESQRCIDQFVTKTGWTPTLSSAVAGALPFTKYNWFVRMIMRSISAHEGGDTDVSKDYEYTDWSALRMVVEQFLAGRTPAVAET